MRKIAIIFVALGLISVSLSCGDGQYSIAAPPVAGKGDCGRCNPICSTCNAASAATGGCTAYKDTVKGVSGTTATCAAGSYNQGKDRCDSCAEGCTMCFIDYDICYECKQGYDWDRSGLKCVRASLGLAAVVLALSVLLLIFGVITCLLACKL